MSWPIGGAAAVMMAALVLGCTQPPARQAAGVARAPLRLPAQGTPLPRPQIQLASASAASDYDRERDRWRDVPIPEPARVTARTPSVTRAVASPPRIVRATTLPPGVGLAPGVGISSVRYAPPRVVPRPAGVLSITQVGLDPVASAHDSTKDSIDELERRLAHGPRQYGMTVPLARGLINPADSLTAVIGRGRPIVSGFGGVEYLPPIRFSWKTGSPLTLGELGLDR